MPSIEHSTSVCSSVAVDRIAGFGDNDRMQDEKQGHHTSETEKKPAKREWVTPAATIKSVAQVTKTGVGAGKDATCHS